MRFFAHIAIFFVFFKAFPQQDMVARQYFEEGSFEKAAIYYEKLYRSNPGRIDYLQYLAASYQQLERYDEAREVLLEALKNSRGHPVYAVELGYNYMLERKENEAEKYYNMAIATIADLPSYAYVIGNTFRNKALPDYALKAYQKGIAVSPGANFNLNYSMASLYGEMGDTEAMYNTYLTLIARHKNNVGMVKRRLGDFITDDPESEHNELFRKALLKRIQTEPDTVWNDLLSWLFVQQKQFDRAFVQEKAVYKRSGANAPDRLMQLGMLAREENDKAAAKEIFTFILNNAVPHEMKLEARLHLLQIEIADTSPEAYPEIEEKFTAIFKESGYTAATLPLQMEYARFLAFRKQQSTKAITLLTGALQLPLSPFDEARLKMTMADILVYEEKFNQALIYYAQIQKLVKNDLLSQTARFKTAQTSFYKGDFKWAETQLKVLKSSTSQLIANDALQLKLLISDNAYEDSTQTALKLYAKADLLAYQHKNKEAIALLEEVLISHKGESIEDEALLRQAELLEQEKEYEKARMNYMKIIEFYPHDILMDDALFALAGLCEIHLNDPEKAKMYYEKLIFGHEDSIYFITARKRYRALRGDAVN